MLIPFFAGLFLGAIIGVGVISLLISSRKGENDEL